MKSSGTDRDHLILVTGLSEALYVKPDFECVRSYMMDSSHSVRFSAVLLSLLPENGEEAHPERLAAMPDDGYVNHDVVVSFLELCGLLPEEVECVYIGSREAVDVCRRRGAYIIDENNPWLASWKDCPKLNVEVAEKLGAERMGEISRKAGTLRLMHACSSGLPAALCEERIQKLTMGKYSCKLETPSPFWEKCYRSHSNLIDRGVLENEPTYAKFAQVATRIQGCWQIWDWALHNHHFPKGIDSFDFDGASLDECIETARFLGIESELDALEAGVPVEDIIA